MGALIRRDALPPPGAQSGLGAKGTVVPNLPLPWLVKEGHSLTVKGYVGTVGTLKRLDASGATVQTWNIGTTTFTTPPLSGTQRYLASCSAGSADVSVSASVLGAAQVLSGSDGGLSLSVAGTTAVNLRPPVATLRVGVIGDSISEQWDFLAGVSASVISPGTARLNFGSAFPAGKFWPGDKIKTALCGLRACNQMDATVTAVDTVSRLWVEYTVNANQEHAATGAGFYIYVKYALWGSGYLANACYQAGIPFSLAYDAAISGGDSVQINEVLTRNIVDCDLAIYASGMNDVYARGWTFAQIKANDLTNLTLAKRARRLAVFSIPARTSASGQWSAGKFAVWRQVNEWRRQWCALNGAVYVDLSAAEFSGKLYCNPLNVNNDSYATGTSQVTSDYVHPVGLGGGVLGAALASRCFTDIIKSDFLPASASVNVADGYVIGNPMMMRTSGAFVTGTATFQNLAGAASPEVADGYTVSADQTSSASVVIKCGVVPRAKAIHGDQIGNAQRIIVDNTTGTYTAIVTLMSNNFGGLLMDGDTLEYGAHVLYSAMATPGSGDPTGLLAGGVRAFEQHATAGSKYNDALSANPGTGVVPGHAESIFKADKMRATGVAGAYATCRTYITIHVATGQSACIDIGRLLGRRVLS